MFVISSAGHLLRNAVTLPEASPANGCRPAAMRVLSRRFIRALFAGRFR
jgi:hypothetical protein